ncbi:MAG: AAA family ATPase [Limnobacter sp.]|nr:AAA family ATPase [Limnobacter sp.]
MRIVRLHLQAFGPFTDRVLEFSDPADASGPGLVLVYGPNEAGKSSTLRAISDFRFGIPQQSSDNFVHAHPDMRIGGVFADRDGREYAMVRRKGRTPTLHFADGGEPVPAETALLLTCGLTRDEYDGGFGIDHARLRRGGRELLEGKGEIGAALFEASAGLRSVPRILDELQASARRYFMPGTRGKHARINEALAAHAEQREVFRQALVRPARWSELARQHQAAADELAGLEAQRNELHRRQLLIGELRAVAPLLANLDHNARLLDELRDAPLLSPEATAQRAAALSGLAEARSHAEAAEAESARQRRRLDGLAADEAILSVRTALRRLAASIDTLDRHRSDLADARAELELQTRCVVETAARIDATAKPDALLERVPGAAAAAGIEQALTRLERAEHALEQHRQAMAQQDEDAPERPDAELPPTEARTALRIACAELDRSDLALKRLDALPAEIEAARRAARDALAAAGLADEIALRRLRPLLDSQIDEASQAIERTRIRQAGLDRRIDEISAALRQHADRHERLLEQGPVPTVDEVRAARERRDRGWAQLRAALVDEGGDTQPVTVDSRALAIAYERAVEIADRLADDIARDTNRAAELQSCRHAIESLTRDRDTLSSERALLDRELAERDAEWQRTLVAARLPALSPRALRDWQALLPAGRRACETLQLRLDEYAQLQGIEARLAASLRDAIAATGLATPASGATLATLTTTAAEVENEIRQREKRLDTAAGQRQQKERHRQQLVDTEMRLLDELRHARAALAPALGSLLLDDDETPAVARARLGEFRELQAARERVHAAEARQRRAAKVLEAFEESVATVVALLGEPAPTDTRLCIERLASRLDAAERVEAARTSAQASLEHALDNLARCRRTAAEHERRLAELCLAAQVDDPEQLPEAEERSRRKREARTGLDRSSAQLARASRRPVAELRELLRDYDEARMDADEAALVREQQQLDEHLREARQREEQARRALEAIDSADTAAAAREAMERTAASVRAAMGPWLRSRLAHGLLAEALKRFRERAQGPMLQAASGYFETMTGGEFTRLLGDESNERPVLLAERRGGTRLQVDALSEGTRDQLYLALRLAALDLRRAAGVDLPVILDDVLMTSDDERTRLMLQALAGFSRNGQVVVFTHHRHVAEIARASLPPAALTLIEL